MNGKHSCCACRLSTEGDIAHTIANLNGNSAGRAHFQAMLFGVTSSVCWVLRLQLSVVLKNACVCALLSWLCVSCAGCALWMGFALGSGTCPLREQHCCRGPACDSHSLSISGQQAQLLCSLCTAGRGLADTCWPSPTAARAQPWCCCLHTQPHAGQRFAVNGHDVGDWLPSDRAASTPAVPCHTAGHCCQCIR